MTDDTDPLHYASHSWIVARVSFNCIGQRTIDSFIGRSQSCGPTGSPFRKPSILLRHASLCACCRPWPVLRYLQPGQPSLRPHCSKSALRRLVLPLCSPSAPLLSILSHLSDSRILLMFAERVLIAVPCSVTTTASDNEFSMPKNTPGMKSRFPFPPSRWFGGHLQDLFSKLYDRCVVPSAV